MTTDRDNKNIGENIRLYRIKSGLKIRNLVKKIEKTQGIKIENASIRKYEKGRVQIPAADLNCIAATLGVDIKAFYEDPTNTVLMEDPRATSLLEAFNMIKHLPNRDMLVYLARQLGGKH